MRSRLASILVLTALLAADPMVASAGATEPAKPSGKAMTYLEEGSRYYLKHDFKGAIGPYAKALELEKKQPSLERTFWRVLIDNLGMAYGISGDLKSAKETFEYGLAKDKTYPMFYYNLACTYAEMNDLEGSILNLKLAFKYKDNVIPGEQMPDPAEDDSFQRFMKNEHFVSTLREIAPRGK